VGFVRKIRTGLKTGEGFLIVLWALHYSVLFLLILNLTDWSTDKTEWALLFGGRHTLPLLIVSIPWIGEGFLTIVQWISRRIEWIPLVQKLKPETKSVAMWAGLLILALAITLPKTLKPQKYDRLTEKWAGIWIKSQIGKGRTILTTMPRVAYYADGVCEYLNFDKVTWDQIGAAMVKKKASFLVIREEENSNLGKATESIQTGFVEAV